MDLSEADPKGLVRESYRIDGISAAECRSVFMDWALSLPPGADIPTRVALLLDTYGEAGHPMTAVLQEGAEPMPEARRRGGRAGRVTGEG